MTTNKGDVVTDDELAEVLRIEGKGPLAFLRAFDREALVTVAPRMARDLIALRAVKVDAIETVLDRHRAAFGVSPPQSPGVLRLAARAFLAAHDAEDIPAEARAIATMRGLVEAAERPAAPSPAGCLICGVTLAEHSAFHSFRTSPDMHPRYMPTPPVGVTDGGPGACQSCNAALGHHHRWCALRGASDAEIARLRAGA